MTFEASGEDIIVNGVFLQAKILAANFPALLSMVKVVSDVIYLKSQQS